MLALDLRLLKARSSSRRLKDTWNLNIARLEQHITHSTPQKVGNAMIAKVEKWLRRDRLIGMPYRFIIDPINVCNLRCPLCPTGLGTLGRKRGKLDVEKYKGLVDQIAPYAYSVELYNWGEPFLHPDIFDIIHYASERKIIVKLSSNLNRFDREMAAKTVASGLDWIVVSVDGATQETYEKYRRGGNLESVFDNVRFLVEAKREAGSKTPFIVLRLLVNRYNEGEIQQLREMSDNLGVDAFTIAVLLVDTTDPKQAEEWLPRNEALSYYDYSAEKLDTVWHCAELWKMMTINWDGGMAPCCVLHKKENDFANAFDRPLKEIWNSDAYISSRRVFAFGGPKEGPQKTICTVCKGHPLYLKD
jgi:MoaA/NifB/PqqE/SkfB family radical SAM enzyme